MTDTSHILDMDLYGFYYKIISRSVLIINYQLKEKKNKKINGTYALG